MSLFVIDVEADGPIPPRYSMVCFGIVKVEPNLDKTFYGETAPISEIWNPDSLAISGIPRKKHEDFEEPYITIEKCEKWISEVNEKGRPIFLSDNVVFDWQWMNYYFHTFGTGNPFGWSGRRIGDLFCGVVGDFRAKWKHLRETKHDHHPVNDAKANAEVILKLPELGIKNIKF